jgi:ribosomal protein S13
MIEGEKLYPVTVMSSLTSAQIKRLIDQHVILMKDLARMKEQDIQRLLSISNAKAIALKNKADELCFCD